MTSIHQWEGKYLLFSKGATKSISENLADGENKILMHQESITLAKEALGFWHLPTKSWIQYPALYLFQCRKRFEIRRFSGHDRSAQGGGQSRHYRM